VGLVAEYGIPCEHLPLVDVAAAVPDAPVLLLTGIEGPAHLRESVHAVHDTLPESRLVEFEGVGHGGPTDAPERTAEAVREFLATAPRPA
jgi:pimeloyl-ACP methyl ester carboxylesterase